MAKVISVLNFKGGVGKTALVFHLAPGISRYFDKRVLIIDIDHQSSLSLVCMDGKTWSNLVDNNKTINSVFRYFTDRQLEFPDDKIIFKNPIKNKYPKLHLVPATLKLDETELELSSTTSGDPTKSEWDKRTLLCKWLEDNKITEKYDYIFIDCPPATKIVTQNALGASNGYIIPVIPEAVSIRGVPHLIKKVLNKIDDKFSKFARVMKEFDTPIYSTYIPETKLVGIVISMIKTSGPAYSGYTSEHTLYLDQLKRNYSNDIIKPYIGDGVGVSESLGAGLPVYDRSRTPNVRDRGFVDIFKDLSAELKKRIDKL